MKFRTAAPILILFLLSCGEIKKNKNIFGNSNHESRDSIYFKGIISKSNSYFDSKNIDSLLLTDYYFLRMAKLKKNKFYAGKASYNLASDFRYLNQPDSAYYYYNLSKNYFEDIKEFSQVGRRLLSMGILQKNQGDYFGAKETLTEAIKNFEKTDDTRFLASAYNELGTNNKKLLDFEEAIKNYKNAILISENKKDLLSFKNNLALAFEKQENYTKSIEILEQIIADSSLKKSSNTYARILHNLTNAQLKKNGTGSSQNFFKALEIRRSNKDFRGLASSYTTLGEIYSKININLAKSYLDSLISVSKRIIMPEAEIDALELYMKLEPQNVAHKDRYIFLNDSLYQQELKVKTQFAKMKYDDEQEKARLLALEAETAQKEAQLAKEGAQRTMLLSLLAILLMGGTSYYFLLRQRHRKRMVQEVYNTEKKISKKIHDGLANDVYGVMTAVQHQNGASTEGILDQLEDIYQRTRDISHDTRELATGEDFALELKDMLQGFNGNGTKVLIKGLEGIPWEKLSEHQCVALHRTLKELLVNMKKHSGAGLVALNFGVDRKKLLVEYSDNGIGVKPGQKHGVGLQNTENRIQSVGGQFIFGGIAGKGAKATLTLPL